MYMTEKLSLILATTILAIGGLGLYMYKNSDEMDDYNEDDYEDLEDDISEDDISEDDMSEDDLEDEMSEDLEDIDEYDKPKSKSKGKTKRARKNGGTKKKY
jgi:hypothetical protein